MLHVNETRKLLVPVLKEVHTENCEVWRNEPMMWFNNLSFKQGRVFLGWTSTKLG